MLRFTVALCCILSAPCALGDEAGRQDDRSSNTTDAAAPWPDLHVANCIDEHVFARLQENGVVPSKLASDTEFLRRLTLTTTGQLPTPFEVRTFLADERADKRSRKIDELLAHKLHAAVWATRFCEMTGNSYETLEGPDELKAKRAQMWHDWLRKRFSENAPYDQIVRGILTATSRSGADIEQWIDDEAGLTYAARAGFDTPYADRATLDLFWRRTASDTRPYPVEEVAERVASSFLGVRINCARCHAHPFDRWTQEDYGAFVNIFTQVRFDLSPELRARLSDRLDARRQRNAEGQDVGRPLPQLREVYLIDHPQDLRDPSTNEPLPPKLLGGQRLADIQQLAESESGVRDRRVALMDWLSESENPFFARNIVNRVWAQHFGRGLVMPFDGFAEMNPPTHPELLDKLAADFVSQGYDIRWLERLILNSTAWQLSSEPNETNVGDNRYFARAYVRIPSPETVVDMWQAASGVMASFGDSAPAGLRAVEIGSSRLGAPLGFGQFNNTRWDRFMKLFGRSARTQTCDCEPPPGPSIRQTLAIMSDPNLLKDVSGGELNNLLEAKPDNNALLDELFLRTLSRLPTDAERSAIALAVDAESDRRAAFENVLWGLLNTQEFVTNH